MSEKLPRGWINSTIGDACSYIQRGKSPKYVEKSNLPVINQKVIRWYGLLEEYLKYIHPDQIDDWDSERYVKENDILWNSTGTGTIGRACLINKKNIKTPKVVDSHVTILRSSKFIIPQFLFRWIQSPAIQNMLDNLYTGTTNQVELSKKNIEITKVPIPPLAEQKRIADKLDILLAKVDSCKARLDKVPGVIKQFRQAVLAAACSGKLTGDSKGYQLVQFGTLIKSIRGGSAAVPTNQETEFPVLRSSSVRQSYIDFNDVKYFSKEQSVNMSNFISNGDLLFTRLNGTAEYVGNCALVSGIQSNKYQYPDRLYCAKTIEKVYPAYVVFAFAIPEIRIEIENRAKSSAGHKRISISDIKEMLIPLPSLKEQHEIVRRIEALFAFADQLEKKLQTAQQRVNNLTASILAKAFRGELVPQDPSDEPAEELLERIRGLREGEVKSSKGRANVKNKRESNKESVTLETNYNKSARNAKKVVVLSK